jgi:uncharacterized phage-associated protein
MPHSSLAVANDFIHKARDAGQGISHMQAQKLVYLAHGWSLGSGHGPLIEEQFEAWTFGPVERKLYDSLKKYGPGPVTQYIRWGDDTPLNDLEEYPFAFEQMNPFESDLLPYIYQTYGKLHAFQLSALTHLEGTPWHTAYIKGQNRPIDNRHIEAYFLRLASQNTVAA